MKKVKKGYMKKLCALILTLCMVIGQTQGVWADELGSVSAAEATEVSEAADATAQAVEAEEITDEAGNAAEQPEEITYQEQKIEELVQEKALNEGEKLPFDYETLDIKAIGAIGEGNYRYTGKPIEPEYEVTYTSISTNTVSGSSTSENKVVLTKGTDYKVVYSDNTNQGSAMVTFTGMGKYEETSVVSYFHIVPSDDPSLIIKTVSGSSITINNKQGEGNTIYVAIVDEKAVSGNFTVEGTPVESGKLTRLTTCYTINADKRRVRDRIKPESNYHIFVSDYESYGLDKESLEENGILDMGVVKTPKDPAPISANLTPGDSINFKAATQKDQSVKLSWAPDKTLGYKSFSIFRLQDGATDPYDESESTWKTLATDIKKKSYVDKDGILKIGHNASRSGVYKLVAKDGSGKATSYIMVASPWLFKTEGGYVKDSQDYYFTAHNASVDISYKMQTALNKNGFSDTEKTVTVESTDLWIDDSYPVNKSLKVDSVEATYSPSKDADKLSIGTKYFFRVQSIYTFGDLTVTSATPSNVLSRKAGPAKGAAYSVKGITPQEYLEKLGSEEVQKQIESDDNFFLSGIHADSDGTCWKKGYVWFTIDNLEEVKEIQLMRATKEDGKYTKVKSFPRTEIFEINYKELKDKLNLTDPEVEELKEYYKNVYWIKYNNFVPEVTYFWAVRAVSSTGKVVGSFYPGVENKTVFEKVQDLLVSDSGFGSIWLTWKHDDCAKQYWIYRAESKEALKSQTKPIKKINANKTETISGNKYNGVSDTTVQKDHSYYYMVRPVYKANKQGYEDFKGWVAETDTPVTATNDNAFCATVKTSVYSVKQVEVKWSGAVKEKNKKMPVDQYQVEVYDGDTLKKTYPVTEKSAVKNRKYVVEVPVVGKTYTFKVKPVTDGKVGDDKNLGDKSYCATHPLKVANLHVVKQNDSAFENGAKVTFQLNSKDKPYADLLSYRIASDVDSAQGLFNFSGAASYTDNYYLSRGTWRSYTVQVVYEGADHKQVVGDTHSVKYGKPNKVNMGSDVKLKTGESETIKVTFKCGGSTATVQDCTVSTSDSDIVSVSKDVQSDCVKIKLKAGSKTGSATVKIKGYRNGPSDSIKVRVERKETSSSSSIRWP